MARAWKDLARLPAFAALAAILAAALATPTPAAEAIDPRVSSEALVTGGLAFPAGVVLRGEEVFVSAEEVRIVYRLANPSPTAARLPLVMRLPDFNADTTANSSDSLPDEPSANFLAAALEAEGRPLAPKIELRAFAGGVDHTAELLAAGAPLRAWSDAAGPSAALSALPLAAKQRLLRLRLVQSEEAGDAPRDAQGRDLPHPWIWPAWTLRTALVWTPTLPAGREIALSLRYKPSVGLRPELACCLDQRPPAERRPYCVDDALIAAWRNARPSADPDEAGFYAKALAIAPPPPRRLLTDFRLVVDKGDEANLLSLCQPSLRKVSPTRFEAHIRNALPPATISLLILTRRPPR